MVLAAKEEERFGGRTGRDGSWNQLVSKRSIALLHAAALSETGFSSFLNDFSKAVEWRGLSG
jgi:hypothetical protein